MKLNRCLSSGVTATPAITASPCLLDLVPTRICAGFPSPAEDMGAERIDLSKVLITHPQATFLQRVSGHSMKDAGIFDNDILVIDRAIKPRHKMIVVAVVDGEFTVKAVTDLRVIHFEPDEIAEMLSKSPALSAEVGQAIDTRRRAAQHLQPGVGLHPVLHGRHIQARKGGCGCRRPRLGGSGCR